MFSKSSLAYCLVSFLLTFYLLPDCFAGLNYLHDIHISYDEEYKIWMCDRLKCPEGTFGCLIKRENHPDKENHLLRYNECYDRQNLTTLSDTWTEKMNETRRVEINFKSFIDAKTVAITSYGLTSQNFVGIIAPSDWNNWREATYKNMLAIEEA